LQMDRERIKQLIDMLNSSSAAELEVREGDLRIRLRKREGTQQPAETASRIPDTAEESRSEVSAEESLEDATIVTAHLVGLFHRGSGPSAEPLAQVGDDVAQGQSIGTIEALRNFTEVTSPVDGTVVCIIAEDGAPVQFGDPLLAIRPKA